MNSTWLPRSLRRVQIPPVKCQGIKSKLVPFIARNVQWAGQGKWIEPFMGSAVVALNLAPRRARLSDTNKHLITFYRAVQDGVITEATARQRLVEMGAELHAKGEPFFYEVRRRFNESSDPIDLLFLNRSCFNGVMRFNSKGLYNVPFGKKTDRFRKAYVTKIVNQICWLRRLFNEKDWEIECCDWRTSLATAKSGDFVYVDPPYIGRHADYFNRWTSSDAEELAAACHALPCGFALSMWKGNRYRENPHLAEHWGNDEIRTFSHFYHVGPTESLRNEMIEALAIKRGFAAPHELDEEAELEAQHVQQSLFGDT